MKELHSIPTAKGYINITIDLEGRTLEWLDRDKDFYRTRQAAHQYRKRLEKKQMDTETAIDFSAILETFMLSDEFRPGIISSTRASWGGSNYKVELLPDGTWRVLSSNSIGNRYESPGIILGLPTFTDDGTYQEAVNGENPMSEEDYFDLCFANEEEELRQEMRDELAGVA